MLSYFSFSHISCRLVILHLRNLHLPPRSKAYCTWEAICWACEGYWGNEIIQGIWQTPSWVDKPASCRCQAEESRGGWEKREEVVGSMTSRSLKVLLHFGFEPFEWTWLLLRSFELINFLDCMDMLIFIWYWFLFPLLELVYCGDALHKIALWLRFIFV